MSSALADGLYQTQKNKTKTTNATKHSLRKWPAMVPECMNPEPENTPSSRSHPRRGTHQPPTMPMPLHSPPATKWPADKSVLHCTIAEWNALLCISVSELVRPQLRAYFSTGIAQRRQHHAIAVPTAMQNRVTKTVSVAPPLGNNWSKRSPTIAQHHLPALDLFWANFFLWDHDTKSSDVDWHIRDKLKPMPKHGSI